MDVQRKGVKKRKTIIYSIVGLLALVALAAVSFVPSGTPDLLAAGVAAVAGCAVHRATAEESRS